MRVGSTKSKRDKDKSRKKKKQSILEKEIFNFIEGMAVATINEAMDDIFEGWK